MPCPHRSSIRKTYVEELKQMAKGSCKDCEKKGPNLWACLQECCDYVGCGRCGNNHIEAHHKEKQHHLCVCLRDFRVWCFSCGAEVDPNKSSSSASSPSSAEESPAAPDKTKVITDEQDFLETERGLKPRGLCGLMNIGNTCYMNSALQALSNCPPLTQHFLECGRYSTDAKHPGVSGNYSQLVNEMWSRKRPKYLVPSHLLRSVRSVNSQFRGYGQQDSQEFLRCIMDQMHEELKEPVVSLLPECDSSDESEEPNHCAKRLLGGTNLPPAGQEEVSHPDEQVGVFDGDTEMLSDTETVDSSSPLHLGSSEQQVGDDVHPVDPEDIQVDTVSDEEEPMIEPLQDEQKGLAAIMETPQTDHTVLPTEQKSKAAKERPEGAESGTNRLKRNNSLQSVQPERERQEDPPKKKREVDYRSIITDLFDGKIQSSVQCLTCNRVSSRIETFQDLSLPIPGKDELSMIHASQCSPLVTCSALNDNSKERGWVVSVWDWFKRWIYGPQVTLQDCLAAFFSADELKGDNMYSCEKCKKLRNGIKLCKVSQLPELLCIHLKRFRHEMYFSSKINHLVSFPLTGLDMRQFLVKDSKSDRCCTTYDLVSVITHHGSVGAGHYVSFAKNYIDGKWYEFNDSWVNEVSDSYVDSVEAYVLFYRKVSDEAQRERRLFTTMTRNAQPQNSAKYFVSKPWLTKFQTCAEPGPVMNTEFICCHGAVQPQKTHRIKDLVVCVPETVWRHFQLRYGGGPAVSQLDVCEQCKTVLEELEKRRKFELETFKKLNSQYPASSDVDEFHISMSWFRRWELFVKGEEEDPPGPIDNNDILVTKGHVKVLRAGANLGHLSLEAWTFLHEIYGGGPVYVLEAEPEEQDL